MTFAGNPPPMQALICDQRLAPITMLSQWLDAAALTIVLAVCPRPMIAE